MGYLKEEKEINMNNLFCLGVNLVFKIFPLKRRILISSYEGMKQVDSPFQIYMYIKNKYPEIPVVWYGNKQKDGKPCIKYNSVKGLFYRATSKIIVDNVFCDSVFNIDNKHGIKREMLLSFSRRKRGQKYVTTWHGTPLKRMGRDQVGNTITDCIVNKPMYFIMGNTYTADIMNHMVFNKAEVKLFGSPRNDILVNVNKAKMIEIKKNLKLPQDKKIVLYAPTFRSNLNMREKYIENSGICQMNMINFDRLFYILAEKFGREWVFICRFHYHVENMVDWENLENKYPGRFINGNLHEDIAEYLLCSDVLITDYSSCMFDYAILNRPVFLFCHDLGHYQNEERGFYTDINELPFPLAENFNELCDNIENFDNEIYCEKLEKMKKKMGYCEEGDATEKAGDFIYRLLKDD